MEDKIKTEMSTLKEKMRAMEDEMSTFSDLDRLKTDAEARRRALEEQRETLTGRRAAVADRLKERQAEYDQIRVSEWGCNMLPARFTHPTYISFVKRLFRNLC